MDGDELEERIGALYALELGEFVAARNDLVRELRRGGHREAADRVKALARPALSAWAVNRLWHEEREVFEELLEAGARLRAAHGGGEGLAAAMARRRQLLQRLEHLAEGVLKVAGHAASRSHLQRIARTLEALSARDPAEVPPPGRLEGDLEPPGFDVLALSGVAAVPSPAGGTAAGPAAAARDPAVGARAARAAEGDDAAAPDEAAGAAVDDAGDLARREALRAALAEARAAHRAARRARDEAAGPVPAACRERDAAARRVEGAVTALQEARAAVESAEEALEEARDELSAAAERAREVEQAAAAAAAEVERAGAGCRSLEEELAILEAELATLEE